MDKKTLLAASLLLGAFVLGALAGGGGVLFLESRWHPRPEGPPPPPPEGRGELPPPDGVEGEMKEFLGPMGLSPDQRAEVQGLFQEGRHELEEKTGPLWDELIAQGDALLSELRPMVPPERLAPLEERIQKMRSKKRNKLPPPERVETGLSLWLATQNVTAEQEEKIQGSISRFMDAYWRVYRDYSDAATRVRRETREKVEERLTPEQRARIRERVAGGGEERRERRRKFFRREKDE